MHAYHEGHSTLLTKLGLLADETAVIPAVVDSEAAQEAHHERRRATQIGLVALTLELYETLAPGLRASREAWLRRALLPALEPRRGLV